jgi:thiamine kinase-like enzyme
VHCQRSSADNQLARLLEPLRAELASQAAGLGLKGDALAIEPILNWGGFMNRSFLISDGHRRLFLKLTMYPDIRRGLERWRQVASRLEAHYHAPRMVGWVDLAAPGFSGPLFEWIDGQTPVTLNAALAAEISAVIQELHGDDDLGHELGAPTRSCEEAYLRAYHQRFTEDLDFIAANPPPFVSRALISWLYDRVEALRASTRGLAAFQLPADRPIHGDLWLNNVWVGPDEEWHLLDWDGVRLGDPMVDWTMLFGPTRHHPYAADVDDVLAHARLNGMERVRLEVYIEASQLDWVIDPLSDWVESEHEPEHGSRIRAANEHVHGQALEAYRTRYG